MTSTPHTPDPKKHIDHLGAPWPGLIPLRPLGISEILTSAVVLVRTHAAVLLPLALLVSALGAATEFLVVANLDSRAAYFDGSWVQNIADGTSTSIPSAVYLPLLISLIVGVLGNCIISGITTVYATEASLGRRVNLAGLRERLRGRWLSLVLITVITVAATALGIFLLVIPGIIIFAATTFAVPISVMEKSGVRDSLRRSWRLSSGLRWRILGAASITVGVGFIVSMVVLPIPTDLGSLALSLGVSALISAFMTPWTSGVIALLYIDARMRKENLATTLQAAADARQ
ncbi:hypothetical protein EH165_04175 [Nakamurella antarctica]|uniref:Membrane domain of glycerophosphoryl diester phosphodiesterase n=1 Tax=Nakamurella antarctica TaxID=1902245 RepID=A0A3G8ZJW7_9ACTN|nr:hypothetical protein [Nakamurella antarctica]AZI57478.1 hypothetical protein EH165_04175 [Nakamurella antarctica]